MGLGEWCKHLPSPSLLGGLRQADVNADGAGCVVARRRVLTRRAGVVNYLLTIAALAGDNVGSSVSLDGVLAERFDADAGLDGFGAVDGFFELIF